MLDAASTPFVTRVPRWMGALLEWFHALMRDVSPSTPARHHHALCAAGYRLYREVGVWVTEHAHVRFLERHGPWPDELEGRAELLELARGAAHVGPAADEGELWVAVGGVYMIVRAGAVVTVLPRGWMPW